MPQGRAALDRQLQAVVFHDLVSKPARHGISLIEPLEDIAFELAEPVGEQAVLDLVARFVGGEILLAARDPARTLVIGATAQLVSPVDPFAIKRKRGGEPEIVAVPGRAESADLAAPVPIVEQAGLAKFALFDRRGESLALPPRFVEILFERGDLGGTIWIGFLRGRRDCAEARPIRPVRARPPPAPEQARPGTQPDMGKRAKESEDVTAWASFIFLCAQSPPGLEDESDHPDA